MQRGSCGVWVCDRGRQILPDLAKKDKFDHLAGVSVEEFTAVGQCFVGCSH